MESVAEAFEAAQQRPAQWESDPVEPMDITDVQVRYAMKVSYTIARQYQRVFGWLDYEDLAQAGLENILHELQEHEHLRTYNAWMGKVAKWAIIDERRRKLDGRVGLTRQGKLRSKRPAVLSLDRMRSDGVQDRPDPDFEDNYYGTLSAPEEDHDGRMDMDMRITNMPQGHKSVVKLLSCGYNRSEIAGILGVSQPAITRRIDTIKRHWHD